MTGVTEDTVAQLAGSIAGIDPDLETLGLALGFKKVKITQYMATNRVDGQIGTSGTSHMLFDWKKKTLKAQQLPELRAALIKAGFAPLAEEYCPSNGGSHQAAGAQPPIDAGPSNDSHSEANEVTNQQIAKLAKLLAGNYYIPLGIALEFEHAECTKMLTTAHLNYTDAFCELLQQWKAKTGGSQDMLDAALRKVDAGGFIPKYKCE